jgi:hypothetical protein
MTVLVPGGLLRLNTQRVTRLEWPNELELPEADVHVYGSFRQFDGLTSEAGDGSFSYAFETGRTVWFTGDLTRSDGINDAPSVRFQLRSSGADFDGQRQGVLDNFTVTNAKSSPDGFLNSGWVGNRVVGDVRRTGSFTFEVRGDATAYTDMESLTTAPDLALGEYIQNTLPSSFFIYRGTGDDPPFGTVVGSEISFIWGGQNDYGRAAFYLNQRPEPLIYINVARAPIASYSECDVDPNTPLTTSGDGYFITARAESGTGSPPTTITLVANTADESSGQEASITLYDPGQCGGFGFNGNLGMKTDNDGHLAKFDATSSTEHRWKKAILDADAFDAANPGWWDLVQASALGKRGLFWSSTNSFDAVEASTTAIG